jgi:hypothetical protein
VMKGVRFDPADPLHLSFIIDTANARDVSKEQVQTLVRYFLVGLTMPQDDIWVNLSPDEPDRIIENNVAATDLGEGLLAQDYVLKQLASSLTAPDTETGKEYWKQAVAGTEPAKLWISPQRAEVVEYGTAVVIKEATLKVESESAVHNVLIPAITKEVNVGEHFAQLRQIYHSLILARWFKDMFKESLYKQYIDQKKVAGIDMADPTAKDKIYALYAESFKKGVYDQMRKGDDPTTGRLVKRRYFSGGIKDLLSSAVRIKAPSIDALNIASIGPEMVADIRIGKKPSTSSAVVMVKAGVMFSIGGEESTTISIKGLLNRAGDKGVDLRIKQKTKDGTDIGEARFHIKNSNDSGMIVSNISSLEFKEALWMFGKIVYDHTKCDKTVDDAPITLIGVLNNAHFQYTVDDDAKTITFTDVNKLYFYAGVCTISSSAIGQEKVQGGPVLRSEQREGGVTMKNMDVASSGVKVQMKAIDVDPSVFEHMQFDVVSIRSINSVAALVTTP